MMFGVLLVFLLCFETITCNNNDFQAYLNASKELHAILDSKSYRPDDRPFSTNTTDGSTNVKMQISILSIGPIDSKAFTFRIDYFMRLWWTDERLKFSKGKVTYTGNPKNKFWLPDLYVMNSREVKSHSLGETYRITINSDGSIYWSTRVSEICSCGMDLHNFPMDEQVCKMIFESYAYTSKELTIDWRETPVELTRGHLTVNDFEVKEPVMTDKEETKYIVGDQFQHLEIGFRVRRTVSNYISRIYLPSSALVVMTWGTFWLPTSTYPARIAIIVTNFLASVLLLRGSDQYTKVPYTTAIDIFFIMNITFIVAAIFEYMMTLHFKRVRNLHLSKSFRVRRGDDVELKSVQAKELLTVEKKPQNSSKKEPTPLTDKVSRFIFPIFYSLFLIVYFSYYLSVYESW